MLGLLESLKPNATLPLSSSQCIGLASSLIVACCVMYGGIKDAPIYPVVTPQLQLLPRPHYSLSDSNASFEQAGVADLSRYDVIPKRVPEASTL